MSTSLEVLEERSGDINVKTQNSLDTGSIFIVANGYDKPIPNALLCDGSAYSPNAYPELFERIKYGNGAFLKNSTRTQFSPLPFETTLMSSIVDYSTKDIYQFRYAGTTMYFAQYKPDGELLYYRVCNELTFNGSASSRVSFTACSNGCMIVTGSGSFSSGYYSSDYGRSFVVYAFEASTGNSGSYYPNMYACCSDFVGLLGSSTVGGSSSGTLFVKVSIVSRSGVNVWSTAESGASAYQYNSGTRLLSGNGDRLYLRVARTETAKSYKITVSTGGGLFVAQDDNIPPYALSYCWLSGSEYMWEGYVGSPANNVTTLVRRNIATGAIEETIDSVVLASDLKDPSGKLECLYTYDTCATISDTMAMVRVSYRFRDATSTAVQSNTTYAIFTIKPYRIASITIEDKSNDLTNFINGAFLSNISYVSPENSYFRVPNERNVFSKVMIRT